MEPYLKVIREKCSEALHIHDRFHIVAKMNKALDEVRAEETRRIVNVGIEAVAGAVPFIGDLFDIAFKANRRNYRLLKSHLSQPVRQTKNDWIFLSVTVLVVIASVALPVIGLIEVTKPIF